MKEEELTKSYKRQHGAPVDFRTSYVNHKEPSVVLADHWIAPQRPRILSSTQDVGVVIIYSRVLTRVSRVSRVVSGLFYTFIIQRISREFLLRNHLKP